MTKKATLATARDAIAAAYKAGDDAAWVPCRIAFEVFAEQAPDDPDAQLKGYSKLMCPITSKDEDSGAFKEQSRKQACALAHLKAARYISSGFDEYSKLVTARCAALGMPVGWNVIKAACLLVDEKKRMPKPTEVTTKFTPAAPPEKLNNAQKNKKLRALRKTLDALVQAKVLTEEQIGLMKKHLPTYAE